MTDKARGLWPAIALSALLGAGLAGAAWASVVGLGVDRPVVAAKDVREGSARAARPGSGGSRIFFRGGGFHGGK
jgi:hypothetical protein